jgi:ABC-2 type transport system permease protein
MKAFDIALKDLTRSFRNAFSVVFMFGVPLLVTGMFYFMFGNIAEEGGFNLPKTKVIIANLDKGGPKFQVNPKNIPGGKKAKSMGDLVVSILQSDDMSDLIEATLVDSAEAARSAVDHQTAQVAIIIPENFSHNFADMDEDAVIEFYQDPTLTIGPSIMKAILNRFMDGMAGVKIAVTFFLDETENDQRGRVGEVVDQYLKVSLAESDDPEEDLLEVRAPSSAKPNKEAEKQNLLLSIIGPIMGGMMVFYAFYTGASTAQSILKEEEEQTLPRLFTTPTSQATILTGKLLSVFMTVCVQVVTLLIAANLLFGIEWGNLSSVALMAAGTILSASSFGIFINSFLKSTKQSGVLFGGVLTVTGMLGMIRIFGSSAATKMGDTVSLLVPQGWAVRGLVQSMNGEPINSVLLTALALLLWSAVFFAVGVWKFNRRYT